MRARLKGLELEGRTRLWGGAGQAFALELTGSLDAVRGDNLDTGEALPRLAPRRARLALEAVAEGWRVGAGLRHSAAQTRVPGTDTTTPGWTLLDLWAAGDLPFAAASSWFARVGNVTDKLATNAASIATVRGLSPLAGRALTVGLRTRF